MTDKATEDPQKKVFNYCVTSKSWSEEIIKRGRTSFTTKYKYAKTMRDWDWPREGELIGLYSLFKPLFPLYLVGKVVKQTIKTDYESGIKKQRIKDRDIRSLLEYEIEVICSAPDVEDEYPVGKIITCCDKLFVRVKEQVK